MKHEIKKSESLETSFILGMTYFSDLRSEQIIEFIKWRQTQLQMNGNVALCPLNV